MFPLALLALLGVGFAMKGSTPTTNAPVPGSTRINPEPKKDDTGRTYYVIEQWNGSAWTEYGIRYLGG